MAEKVIDATLGTEERDPGALVPVAAEPPGVLPTVVLDDLVPFPGPVMPILLDTLPRRDAVLHAKENAGLVLLVNQVANGRLSPVGCLARIARVFSLPDERVSVLVEVLRRAQPLEEVKSEPFPVWRV